jgi:predicted amidohydrolase YtcJ
VILGANPLKVPPRTIKDIPVLQTVKEGQVVWRAER